MISLAIALQLVLGPVTAGATQPPMKPPTFNPVGGSFSSAQAVTLVPISPGKGVYYCITPSGTCTPTREVGTRADSAIAVASTTTICARAYDGAYRNRSKVVCSTYVINQGGGGNTTDPWPLTCTSDRYVVSTGGSDSNSGASGSPWATVSHASSVATAGMCIHVGDGTYSGTLSTSASGSSWSAPITFISTNRFGAKIQASSGNANVWTISGQYIIVQGFELYGSTRFGIHGYSSHLRIRGCKAHYSPPDCSTGGAGFNVDNFSASDIVFDGNIAYHDTWGSGSCALIHGLYLSSPGNIMINNIAYHNWGWGIHLYHCASQFTIANNTVFNNAKSGILIGSANASPDSCPSDDTQTVVMNNISTNNAGGCMEENNSGHTYDNTYIDNTCYGNGGFGNTISLLSPPAGGSISTVSGTLTSNPLYVNYTGDSTGDYHLQSSSPSIDSGVASGLSHNGTTRYAPTYDFNDGSTGLSYTRPQGTSYDRGAYEYPVATQLAGTNGTATPVYLCASGGTCTGQTVTGNGLAKPNLTGAVDVKTGLLCSNSNCTTESGSSGISPLAVGNGSTNDLSAFNNALTYATSHGVAVFVPAPSSSYYMGTSGTLSISASLVGDGSYPTITGPVGDINWPPGVQITGSNVSVYGLTFDGNYRPVGSTTQCGNCNNPNIYVPGGVSNITVRDSVLRGSITDAVQIDQSSDTGPSNVWFDNIFIDNPVRQGFVPYNGTKVALTNSIINMSPQTWGRPIDFEPLSGNLITYFEASSNWINETNGWCAVNLSGYSGALGGNHLYFVNNIPCGTSPSTSKCYQSATSGSAAHGYGPGFFQELTGTVPWGTPIIFSPNTGCTTCSCSDTG